MHAQPSSGGHFSDLKDVLQGENGTPSPVVSILDHHQTTYRIVGVVHSNCCFYLGGVKDPPVSRNAGELNGGKDCPRPTFEVHSMTASLDDHIIPGLGMGLDGQLVSHCS